MNCVGEIGTVNLKSKPISRVWYYEYESNEFSSEIASSKRLKGSDEHLYQHSSRTWNLTVNERELKGRNGVRTATLDDVYDLGCVGGDLELRENVIHIDDGFFVWIEDDNGIGEYELVDDLKDMVLSRMEDNNIHIINESFYEEVLGWENWKIHSWMDFNNYEGILG